jgi:Flp pilus assembly protein TadG
MPSGKRILSRAALSRLGDRGSVAVEYALCLPFLLAFIYGIVEVSHFAYLRTTMSNVAHDASRYAVVHSSQSGQPLTTSDITTYASAELSSLGLNPAGSNGTTVTVTYSPDNTPGSTVNVTISYPFVPFMPGFDQIPGSSASFTALAGPIVGVAQLTLSP